MRQLQISCKHHSRLKSSHDTTRYSQTPVLVRLTPRHVRRNAASAGHDTQETSPTSAPSSTCDNITLNSSEDSPSISGRSVVTNGLLLGLGTALSSIIIPATAHAAEFAPAGFLELVLRTVENLGPFGPLVFVLTVAVFESIPLFPTQPLSLASGILFGAYQGALYMLTGTTAAAVLAFMIARGVGRPLAERIIKAEMAEENSGPGAKLQSVVQAIEQGAFWQQAGAVFLLRLTPVVPFSASNYVLGLSPLPVGAYITGSVGGMAFWAALYASLGDASRTLLRNGANPDALLADVLERAGGLSQTTTLVVAAVGGIFSVLFLLSNNRKASEENIGASSVDPEESGSLALSDWEIEGEVVEQTKK